MNAFLYWEPPFDCGKDYLYEYFDELNFLLVTLFLVFILYSIFSDIIDERTGLNFSTCVILIRDITLNKIIKRQHYILDKSIKLQTLVAKQDKRHTVTFCNECNKNVIFADVNIFSCIVHID